MCNTTTSQKKTKQSSAMHALPNEFYRCYQEDRSISNLSAVWYYLSFLFELQLTMMLVNSEGPNQISHLVASDLGMHC